MVKYCLCLFFLKVYCCSRSNNNEKPLYFLYNYFKRKQRGFYSTLKFILHHFTTFFKKNKLYRAFRCIINLIKTLQRKVTLYDRNIIQRKRTNLVDLINIFLFILKLFLHLPQIHCFCWYCQCWLWNQFIQ